MMKDNNMLYGMRPVIEAIAAGKEIDKLMLQQGLKGELVPELRKLINENNIPYQYVPIEKLNRLVRGNHQGVVCFVSPVIFQPIENLLLSVFDKGETPLFIILDRITDVRNMGAIARTAECAGAHGLIIPEKGGAPISADAMKASAGALNSIPVHRSSNLKNTIDYLKQSGLKIVAASEKGKSNYYDTDLTGPLAIIMGSEEDGVSGEYLRRCDEVLNIPMRGTIGSLNVSVAAGILLFEVVKQHSNT
ncbi:MAG: 23S rRNA (guanosine(2251)-2'-O)-methyltransferase RlmB [Lentimicrobiaceae bacterium]|nr:23S rRNA (guanosine(2251)-2'-O)-methyltransferase RlmB [Lentimicrobiaceae bacterium]MCB9023765.1 23S rRNA (guanosine(2251)-2'-O)-methyltransferase RlmB [Lentimicrobiaceae bacterium]MCO5265304.1 23S rRNA (guanosine(2251)-2'-O)-methyltransferase RlmB [Lentimicrobium sp.]HPG32414.1 23S rRNA (guanosine(2251)-2'-O)-methyltransferase RlmB [Lentimicrobium sp.]